MSELPVKQQENRKRKNCFQPGQSGNPKGRPRKEFAIAEILREIGESKHGGKTKRQLVLEKVYELALKGVPWAVEFIADRTEGKALERVQTDTMLHEEIKVIE